MAYATTEEVMAGFRELSEEDKKICEAMLEEAAIIIDSVAERVNESKKKLVSCRMVRRAIGDNGQVPMGATQGSMSALGYSQSWTLSNGSTGELYLSKMEKRLLGMGNRIGVCNPLGGDSDA